MKIFFVCFVFALLAGSSISVPIEPETADLSDAESKVRSKKSTDVSD